MTGAHNTRRAKPREAVRLNLLTDTIEAIRAEAQARNVPFMTFAAALLDTIARDGMFDAVLDGEFPKVKEGA